MDDKELSGAINYELLVEDALRTVVRGALAVAEHEGLPGESHFYITFQTGAEGVQMAESLRSANPQEMTIVLQHQFWDLSVSASHFSVTLSFSGVQHNLNIPFSAVTHFTDPSVGFGLQFSVPDDEDAGDESAASPATDDRSQHSPSEQKKGLQGPAAMPAPPAMDKNESTDNVPDTEPETAEIVSLDRFRKDTTPKN